MNSPHVSSPLQQRTVRNNMFVALPLVVLIVPQGTIERTLIPEFIFATFMVIIAMAILARHGLHSNSLSIPRRNLHPLMLSFLTYFIFINPAFSLFYGNSPERVLLTTLPFILLSTYYLFCLERLSIQDTRRLIVAFGLSGIIMSGLVIWNYFSADYTGDYIRSTAIEGSRTLSLPLIPMAGVFFLSLFIFAVDRWQKIFFALFVGLCFVAILMSVTRAMLLSFLVGAAFSVLLAVFSHKEKDFRRRFVKKLLMMGGAFIVVALPFADVWFGRFDPDSEGDASTILGRFDEYAAFFDGFLDSPILGKGLGHLFVYPSVFDLTLSENGITIPHSHLFFLAGTTGVIGIALYYALLGSGLLTLWRAARSHSTHHGSRSHIIGIFGAAVTGILFTLSSTTFTTLSYTLFMAIFAYTSRLDWRKS